MHLVSVVVNDRAAPVDVGAQYGRAMTSSMDDELTYDKAQVHTVVWLHLRCPMLGCAAVSGSSFN